MLVQHEKTIQTEMKVHMLKISFVKMNSFLSYIFPVLEFLNFWRSDSFEFLRSSLLCKKIHVEDKEIKKEVQEGRLRFRKSTRWIVRKGKCSR